MDAKTSEWRPGPSVCRCCLTEGCYKDISTEYFWMGKREVYAEMLSETLNVSISYSQAGGPNSNSRLICELCISRLRDASDFRRQVVECEKSFMQHLDPCSSMADIEVNLEPLGDGVKLECVKLEKSLSDDDYDDRCDFPDDDDDDDDLDDQPLTKLASRIPKKETVDIIDIPNTTKSAEKRKSTTKIKLTPVKKTKVVKIEPMKAGVSKMPTKVAGKLSTKVGGKAASKTTQKTTEKKKKDATNPLNRARRNAELIVSHATVYPFRLPETSLVCVYCAKIFPESADFRKHMADEHKSFDVRKAFANHYNENYLKIDCTELACRFCGDRFVYLDDVARHLNAIHRVEIDFESHMGLHPFKFVDNKLLCGVCDDNFPCMRQLSRHLTTHVSDHTCDLCGKPFNSHGSLKKHISLSHNDAGRVCRKCKMTFNSLDEKKAHTASSPNCWHYACVKCNERFMTWLLKETHLIEAHGLPKKTYTCPECHEEFTSRWIYTGHFTSKHAERCLICSECDQKFASLYTLRMHRETHKGLVVHHCTVCAKTFDRKKYLHQHMYTHKGRRFECIACDMKFTYKVSFKTHMKSYHPDVMI